MLKMIGELGACLVLLCFLGSFPIRPVILILSWKHLTSMLALLFRYAQPLNFFTSVFVL